MKLQQCFSLGDPLSKSHICLELDLSKQNFISKQKKHSLDF